MSLHAKVVFPTPPPTTNALTPEQRIQLVRKTRKIEQIFGTTPYLLDSRIEAMGAFHVHFPTQTRASKDSKTKTRTFSMDSSSSDSSSNSPVSISRKLSLQGNARSESPRNIERRSSSRPSTPSSVEVQESWPVNHSKSPVLRLAVQSPLDTIPASPDPTTTTFTMEPLTRALDLPNINSQRPSSSHSESFNGVAPELELVSSPQSTSFIIPSLTSIRKQKLDRLRKKLGCEVPLNLMLSQVGDLDDSDVSPSRPASLTDSRHQYNVHSYALSGGESPKPIPRVKKPTTAKIAGARDSIEESTFSSKIHRAKRQLASAGLTKKASKKTTAKKMRKEEEVPPSPRPVISSPTDFRVIKEKLSLIIESPEEHGTGCSEEFGLSRMSTRSSSTSSFASMARSTTSLFDSGNVDVKMWSTRKGYEGWRSSTPSEASSTPPTTPSSPVSTQGLVRRSSSYRKPPPPIPADCL